MYYLITRLIDWVIVVFEIDPSSPAAAVELEIRKKFFIGFRQKVQWSLDKETDLRNQGWGRYRQRGRYFQSIFWLNNLESIALKHKPLDIPT